MKFKFDLQYDNISTWMQRFGYAPEGQDEQTGELRFTRPLAGMRYPRFHIYCLMNRATNKGMISLHLDQKQPSYQGSTAHSGEYNGELVEGERARILEMIRRESS